MPKRKLTATCHCHTIGGRATPAQCFNTDRNGATLEEEINWEQTRQFAGKLADYYTGGILSFMIDIGYKTGLLEAAAKGPGTSQQLAERASLDERYVREWLGAMTTGGVFSYDPVSRTYTLPLEHAHTLTGQRARNMAPMSQLVAHLGKNLNQVADAFRNGGGVPYSEFRPEFTGIMDALGRRRYDELLITGYLPAVKGMADKLRQGGRVADIGCGTGHCINLMAKEFPGSSFVGYDFAEDAIARARAEADNMGLTNARFEVQDAACLPPETRFDLITAFDSIHDQVAPATVLSCIRETLSPDGVFMMIDSSASSNLEDNLKSPMAPFSFGVSVLHCLTITLSQNGAGLGNMWGRQTACRLLSEAGFGEIEVLDAPPGDPGNCIYVCRC